VEFEKLNCNRGVKTLLQFFYSLPYKNIVTYAVETAGRFDLDSEIKLNLSGGISIKIRFMKEKIWIIY